MKRTILDSLWITALSGALIWAMLWAIQRGGGLY